MKKMRKIFAVLLTLAMVLGMSMTTFAAKVTDRYADDITVSNLAEGVDTTLKLYNIIYLDETNGNQSWVIVDWAKDYIEVDTATGNYTVKDGLKEAAESQSADQTVTESGTSHTFTSLPIGAYVILASDTAGTYGLMIANTYDKSGEYMASKTTNVTAKLENYNVTKETDDTFVHRGQTVNFTVTTQFPPKKNEEGKELKKFVIIDTPTGLKINGITKVTIAGQEVTITDDMITETVENGTTTKYEIDLSSFIESSESGSQVVVEYSATVMDAEKYTNTVNVDADTVDYNNDSTEGFEANITLTKVDSTDTTKVLNGAEFEVSKDNTVLYFVKESDGVYHLALDANEEGATTTIAAPNGTVQIKGLDEGTYSFKETKAPEGYKLRSDSVDVTVSAGNGNAEVTLSEQFTNTKLSELPSTGGIGTTIFTIAGCAIMIAAAGLFFATRKKSEK